jgi:hypoxanthine phosphoribosyltransferase
MAINEVVLMNIPQVQTTVKRLASQLSEEIQDKSDVLFVGILKGCLFFMSDLLRSINFECDYSFVKASSYTGQAQADMVEVDTLDLVGKSLKGKTVVLVDEMCDTGMTLAAVRAKLKNLGAKKVYTCVLLDKPSRRKEKIVPDFIGQTIPDRFVIGYGLDMDNKQRTLPYIYYREEYSTNRDIYEGSTGIGIDPNFFTVNNIDPDARYEAKF